MKKSLRRKSGKNRKKSGISRLISKFLIIIGFTLMIKGLKGWIRVKKNELLH